LWVDAARKSVAENFGSVARRGVRNAVLNVEGLAGNPIRQKYTPSALA